MKIAAGTAVAATGICRLCFDDQEVRGGEECAQIQKRLLNPSARDEVLRQTSDSDRNHDGHDSMPHTRVTLTGTRFPNQCFFLGPTVRRFKVQALGSWKSSWSDAEDCRVVTRIGDYNKIKLHQC
jgi:hypothetical protein